MYMEACLSEANREYSEQLLSFGFIRKSFQNWMRLKEKERCCIHLNVYTCTVGFPQAEEARSCAAISLCGINYFINNIIQQRKYSL